MGGYVPWNPVYGRVGKIPAQAGNISKVRNENIFESANSVDPNEVAHYEPPHLDLHYLSSKLCIL